MSIKNEIKIAQSFEADARVAVREFHAAVTGPKLALVIFFCSSDYDLAAVADEINALFPDVSVIGCTTAGEIGPAGYLSHSISGASFPAGDCTAVVGSMDRLQTFDVEAGRAFVAQMLLRLDVQSGAIVRNRCAIELIDGMSQREETVVHILQRALGTIPLVGGSAGDDQKFLHPQVFCDGAFHADRVALAIIDMVYPVTIFKTQHFVSGQERLVVTDVDTASRTVKELNGLPAAQEYARVIGITPDELTASHFSASPVVVRINGVDYVRSIQQANQDGSLTFYCAIDKGLILRVAHGHEFIGNVQDAFDGIKAKIGLPQLVIGCDCIFRRVEMNDNGLTAEAEHIYKQNHVVGFSTYGEQFMGIHVNQTLTGLAIGSPEEKIHD